MLKTRSSDRRQVKAEMKGTKPHSIVEHSVAADSAAATKNIISKKNQKQTTEIVKSAMGERVEVGGMPSKPTRFGSTIVSDMPAKNKKSIAKKDVLMEVKKVKSPKNAPNIKVELDTEVNNLHFTTKDCRSN